MAEVLSQNEIDSLLDALSSGQVDVEEIRRESETGRVKIYDFRHPTKLSKNLLRTLQMIYDNYSSLVTSALSARLRSVVNVKIVAIDQITYEEFIRSLPQPTILGVGTFEPLQGNFIMEMEPEIGFTIIDLLFGGLGKDQNPERAFTAIEEVVLRKVFNWFLDSMPEAWANVIELKPGLVAMESNPLITQAIPPNDMIILVTMEAKVARTEGLLNFCLPYIMLEPIVDKLNAQYWFTRSNRGQTEANLSKLKNRISKAYLPVKAELGRARLTVRDVLNLQIDDVIQLEAKIDDDIILRIGDHRKYKGRPGQKNKRYAVKITDVCEEEEEELG
ncbi:MAG: flagellar motor switch protein FliM [Halanaerobium sp.]|nr:flagellar motor switch protein FliM [Halanaerobium sp.]